MSMAYDYELLSKQIGDAIETANKIAAETTNATEIAHLVDAVIDFNEARNEVKRAKEVAQ